MNEQIKNHNEQAEFRSKIDAILRISPLTKAELYEVINLSYREAERLQEARQQDYNRKNRNVGL